jgi:hypothetical protein
MGGGRRRSRSSAWALVLAVAFGASARATSADEDFTNVRVNGSSERFALGLALAGAARQLDDPGCQALLDEFSDGSARPLRASLVEAGLSPSEYLRRGVFFYDAPQSICGTSNLAITKPGSRAIFVCGARFVREMKGGSRHGQAVLIHELLHSLGLGENPPSSDYITERVMARCGARGPRSTRTRPRTPWPDAASRAGALPSPP